MPTCYNKFGTDFSLSVWKITEQLDELLKGFDWTENEKRELSGFKNEHRRLQWLCSRILLRQLISEKREIVYDGYGKPSLLNSPYKISISHSKNFVAVIVSKKQDVGIDIEVLADRIEKIAKKFISPAEWKFLANETKREQMYVLWCAKETLFKLYSKGELDFKENLSVSPFSYRQKGSIHARVQKNSFVRDYTLCYEEMNDCMLVYGIGR